MSKHLCHEEGMVVRAFLITRITIALDEEYFTPIITFEFTDDGVISYDTWVDLHEDELSPDQRSSMNALIENKPEHGGNNVQVGLRELKENEKPAFIVCACYEEHGICRDFFFMSIKSKTDVLGVSEKLLSKKKCQ
jgi:hypothetical protein